MRARKERAIQRYTQNMNVSERGQTQTIRTSCEEGKKKEKENCLSSVQLDLTGEIALRC